MTPTHAEDVRAVEVANTAFYTAIESGDLDLLGAVWLDRAPGSDVADVTCVHPGWTPLQGRSSVLRSFAAIMAGTPYIQFFLTDVGVRVSGDVAVLTCAENILTGIAEPDAEPGDGFAGGKVVATNVYRRTPAGWRLWVRHASPVLSATDDDDEDEEEAR